MPLVMESSEPAPRVTRSITVVLSEEEWRAFLDAEPQPVSWLKERILERVRTGASAERAPGIGTA
jgi:hypothetical protein